MLNPTAEAWQGVNSLIDLYAQIGKEDKVVIVFTEESKSIAAWVSSALEMRDVDLSTVWMAPLEDNGLFNRLMEAIPSPDKVLGNLVIFVFEVETLSHSGIINTCIRNFDADKTKIFRIMSSIPELFSTTLQVDPKEISARNATILNRCMKAKHINISCSNGTNLDIELDNSKFSWISNRGLWRPGSTIILPAGEVATFPANINGTLVADVAYNINTVIDRDVRLQKNPVTVTVKDGKAVDHFCACKDTMDYIDECFKSTNGNIVGELGIGTNLSITNPISENSQINERFPGVHLGFGQHNQADRVDYYSERHIDLIAKGGFIVIDGESDIIDLGNVIPSYGAHPARVASEDAFSPESVVEGDCCGLTL